jgi:hypothetical protein
MFKAGLRAAFNGGDNSPSWPARPANKRYRHDQDRSNRLLCDKTPQAGMFPAIGLTVMGGGVELRMSQGHLDHPDIGLLLQQMGGKTMSRGVQAHGLSIPPASLAPWKMRPSRHQARIMLPGLPRHVTRRGDRRQKVFFDTADYTAYLTLLPAHCRAGGVAIWSWWAWPGAQARQQKPINYALCLLFPFFRLIPFFGRLFVRIGCSLYCAALRRIWLAEQTKRSAR